MGCYGKPDNDAGTAGRCRAGAGPGRALLGTLNPKPYTLNPKPQTPVPVRKGDAALGRPAQTSGSEIVEPRV